MLDLLPLALSGLALLGAVIPLPGLERARLVMVLLALGCGQIYVAVAALGVLLVVENKWRLPEFQSHLPILVTVATVGGILLTTFLVPTSGRTYTELAQLALYLLMTGLLLAYLRTGEDIHRLLTACVFAATGVALIGLLSIQLGLQTAPAIFLARGPNEGAIYLSLIGAVPATIMFVRTRNPLYLVAFAVLLYAQNLATARGSMIASVVAALAMVFFVTRIKLLRAAMVAIGLYVVLVNVSALTGIYQENLNFSARERLALFNYGWWLWEQRPITGWGWGSTTDLAQHASTTVLVYPHFHNTYIQLLVEAGVVGWFIIGLFLWFVISSAVAAVTRVRQPAVSALVLSVGLALFVSGFFDAMLYGADRAVQVIILLTLVARALALAPRASAQASAAYAPALPALPSGN